MVGNLIRKDLILGSRVLVLNASIFVGYFCLALLLLSLSVRGYVFLSGIMCALIPVTVIGREDKLKAQALVCSLPVTRRSVVLARYVESIALGCLGVLVAIFVGLVAPWSRLPAEQLLAGRTVVFGVTVAAVVIAFLLPFLQRFGIWGLMGLLVAGQVLAVVATLLFSMVGRVTPVQLAIRGFLRAVVAYHGRLGSAAYAAVGLAAVSALLVLSYAVARLAFERRDL